MEMCFFVFLWAIVCVQSVYVPKLDAIWMKKNDHECGMEASANLIHHNPWLVYLEYFDKRGLELPVRCGATLITRRHLVTAGHCIKDVQFYSLTARLGEYDLNTRKDCVHDVCADALVKIDINKKKIHMPPSFDGREDDIAILELDKDAPYTDFIRPVCLPTGNIDKVIFTAAGWGEQADQHVYSHVKKIIPLPSWNTEDCRKAYNNLQLPEKILCAGGEEGKDTCRGDSGGPLTLQKDRVELWGVTSSGNVKCGTEGSPGIYTNVLEHLDWIKKVINS